MLVGFDIAKEMLKKVEVTVMPEMKAVVISTMFVLMGAEVDPATQLCFLDAQRQALEEVFPLLPGYGKIVVGFEDDPGLKEWEERMNSGLLSCVEDIVEPIITGTHAWTPRLDRSRRGVMKRLVPAETFALITIYYSIRELNKRDISYDFGWTASLIYQPPNQEKRILATTSIEKTRPLRGAQKP